MNVIGIALGGVLFLIILVLAVHAVIRGILPPPGPKRGAACGRCGYELTGLSDGRCPECGSDLIIAGVLTRPLALQYAGSTPVAMVGWTGLSMLFMGVGLVVIFTSASSQPPPTTTYIISGFTTLSSGSPRRAADLNLLFDDFEITRELHRSGTISLALVKADGSASDSLELDAATRTLTIRAPKGAVRGTPLPLNQQSIETWLASTPWANAAHDPSPYSSAVHAQDASRLLKAFEITLGQPSYNEPSWNFMLTGLNTSGGSFSLTPSVDSSVGVAMVVVIGFLASAAALWLGGLWYIVHRRRRLFSAAEPPAV